MARLDTILINLDDCQERLDSATVVLQDLGLAFHRLSAFDGRGVPVRDLPNYDGDAALRAIGRELTGGEVGCYLSHVMAAEQFLRGDATFGLVVEDDLGAAPEAAQTLRALLEWLEGHPELDWDLANLGATSSRHFDTLLGFDHPNRLRRAFYFPMTTTAILWNRRGAERFLAVARPVFMPIDHFLRHWVATTGRGLAMQAAILPAGGMASIIDQHTPRRKTRRNLRSWIARQRGLLLTKRRAARTMRAWEGQQ